MTHNVSVSSWLAYVLFLICAGIWASLIWRSGARLPSSLAIVALITASFLAFYHSIPDVSLLIIALCDAFPASLRDWTRIQKLICILLFLMMLPQRSIFVFFAHHLSPSILRAWWWDLFFTRNMVWLLLGLSIVLILRMREVREATA
jgi:ABC-type Na+ efflux pump permease subunit